MAKKVGLKTKTPMPCADPRERRQTFQEVATGYTVDMAKQEADRCIQCKNRPCIAGCPVEIDIPAFVQQVADGDFYAAFRTLTAKNVLPAICGRVCPQEEQCEKLCTLGVKFEPVGIGRLEHREVHRVAERDFLEVACPLVGVLERHGGLGLLDDLFRHGSRTRLRGAVRQLAWLRQAAAWSYRRSDSASCSR